MLDAAFSMMVSWCMHVKRKQMHADRHRKRFWYLPWEDAKARVHLVHWVVV